MRIPSDQSRPSGVVARVVFLVVATGVAFPSASNLAIAQSPTEALSDPLVLQGLNLAAANLTGNVTGADHPDGPGQPREPAKYGKRKDGDGYWKAKNEGGEITIDLEALLGGSGATSLEGATIVLMGTLIHENLHGTGVGGGGVYTDFDGDGVAPPTDQQCEHAQAHLAQYEYYCWYALEKGNPDTPAGEEQLTEACAIVKSKLESLKAMGTLLTHCAGRTEQSTSGTIVLPDVDNYQGDLEPCPPCNESTGGGQ